ncbi:hypothetical protein ZEAMMB73_Zm00001d004699 [Zea mays]|jgi:hypothetical protein|uniref:Uncharacterized protein n=1 Tax=Zea mays TaxID=4577 RepID=A0A1D6EH15_MAIZE|nr:hypothetical protein ZEAMMB73_Zm00001d004699 [Zea mays]
MTFSVGTPPQKLSALADTGSDLIWVKCGACKRCAPQGALLPTTLTASAPPFSTLRCSSNLCNDLPAHQYSAAAGAECSYKYSYGLASDPHHYTQGYRGARRSRSALTTLPCQASSSAAPTCRRAGTARALASSASAAGCCPSYRSSRLAPSPTASITMQ